MNNAISVDISKGEGKGSTYTPYDRSQVHFVYCMVFSTKPTNKKISQEKHDEYRKDVISRIIDAGCEVQCFFSVQKDEIYVKVGASDNRLLQEAEIAEEKLELDEEAMRVVAKSSKDPERNPIYLEAPWDPTQHFDGYSFISNSWVDLSESEITSHMNKMSSYGPFEHLFATYNDEWEKHHLRQNGVQIYKMYADGSILRNATRIKLVQVILERSIRESGQLNLKGAGLNIGDMIFKKKILAAFAAVMPSATLDAQAMSVDQLYQKWGYFWKFPWTQPLDDIRDYFGEKIALYFCFLAHYTKWLTIPALVGFCIFIAQLVNVEKNTGAVNFFNVSGLGKVDATNETVTVVYTDLIVAPFFAFFISLWTTLMLEMWKRKQAHFVLKYGMSGYEQREVIRPEFLPSHHLPSPVTGKREPYLSPLSVGAKLTVSLSIVGTAITIVVAAIAGIFVLKVVLTNEKGSTKVGLNETDGGYVALVVNAVVIQLLAAGYKSVAKFLNDFENHKTDTFYEDALITKTFIFSFVNSYATLFYIAFVKSQVAILEIQQFCFVPARDGNAVDACFGDLGTSLLIIFATQIIMNNTLEVVVPLIGGLVSKFKNLKVSDEVKKQRVEDNEVPVRSPAEDQFFLAQYDGTLGDYLELALQFGYATMFVTAFPLAPFLAFVNNWLEVRVDSFKICKLSRRPELKGAEDIGTWQAIFEAVSFVAVVTNAAVVCFTSNVINAALEEQHLKELQGKFKGTTSVIELPFEEQITYFKIVAARRVWVFVCFIVAISSFKWLIQRIIADVPPDVTLQLQRNDYLVRKCLRRERDDEDDFDEDDENDPNKQEKAALRKQLTTVHEVKIEDTDPEIETLLQRIREGVLESLEGRDPKSLFDNVKSNKKGINKRDFTDLLQNLNGINGKITVEEIEILMTAIDTNGNGYIDKNEFLILLANDSRKA